MLQTAKKILTSTNFHLQDVLKLKKRIIFHFRLFCSTFGHLKKKSKICSKIAKSHIFEISNFDLRLESAGNRPICGRKVGSVPKSFQNFFYAKRTKIDELISKKHTPPKKGLFFWGGGSGDRWSLRTMCLGLFVFRQCSFFSFFLHSI